MAVAAKIPLPRMLAEKETMESLKHWKVTFKTYYRRDSVFKVFLTTVTTWNPTAEHFGLAADPNDAARTAAVMAEDLKSFLEVISAYLPNSYCTEKMLLTKNLDEVWDIIDEFYGCEKSSDSLLDFAMSYF